MQLNEVVFAGYVGNDAEVRTTQGGNEGVNFRLCHTRKQKTGVDESTWVNVQVYGPWAADAKLIRKGDNVLVKGTLRITSYKDKAGVEKTFVSIMAFNVAKLDKLAAPTRQEAPSRKDMAPQYRPLDTTPPVPNFPKYNDPSLPKYDDLSDVPF